MTTLCATGKTVGAFTGKTYDAYLWARGSYKYEIEVKITAGFCDCEIMNTSYEDAFKKFEAMCVDGEVSMPINNENS
jgi:hypothetical protein